MRDAGRRGYFIDYKTAEVDDVRAEERKESGAGLMRRRAEAPC